MIHQFQCNACKATWFTPTRHGHINFHACGPLPPTNKDPERERPDKRDENILLDGQGRVSGIKSEGAGVTCLTDESIREPVWITAMYASIDEREGKENA